MTVGHDGCGGEWWLVVGEGRIWVRGGDGWQWCGGDNGEVLVLGGNR
ncbi:hypothetical protein HanOQP8_Chr14g0509761 [Helianthus annuus]|nr:hypothetical protein HanOQP8_Chr14g0509761 [Helianthus annuus]KAJ0838730.1 hypothetical protein HanPSC8_Chr14g0598241 [Helianthus annuus]